MIGRRGLLLGAAGLIALPAFAVPPARRPIDLIEARTNLGLRPNAAGALPGTALASRALLDSGLGRAIAFREHHVVAQQPYSREREPGTRLCNGSRIRAFNLELADAVGRSRRAGGFPLIVGGECSDLLGGLLGLRRTGGHGLVHLDGHGDFLQPRFYPASSPLHSAAGMDLALATGRGDKLLTEWPGVAGPLAADTETIQFGDRSGRPDGRPIPLFDGTAVTQLTLQNIRLSGLAAAIERLTDFLESRRLDSTWLHIDVDILDRSVLAAVDSPGSPGLDFDELAAVIRALLATGRIGGADVAIYDPDLDPDRSGAHGLVACLGAAFAP